jgi:hypothetical protein
MCPVYVISRWPSSSRVFLPENCSFARATATATPASLVAIIGSGRSARIGPAILPLFLIMPTCASVFSTKYPARKCKAFKGDWCYSGFFYAVEGRGRKTSRTGFAVVDADAGAGRLGGPQEKDAGGPRTRGRRPENRWGERTRTADFLGGCKHEPGRRLFFRYVPAAKM